MPRAPAGAEPHLGLALGLGPVVDEQRQLGAPGPEQVGERYRVPADGLGVHQYLVALLDRARYADARAEHAGLLDAGPGDHLAQPGGDQVGDRDRVGVAQVQDVVHGGQGLHGQVEQLDLDAGLADVDADHVPVARVDAQQHPRPAAVGVDQPGLDHQPLVDQLSGDVADRALAQAGDPAEVLPAERAVEEQLGQQHGPVLPPDVARRGPRGLHARANLYVARVFRVARVLTTACPMRLMGAIIQQLI